MDLSLEELARRTGRPLALLTPWCDSGLLGDRSGRFHLSDVERVGLIESLLGRGVGLDRVAQALRDHGGVIERFVGQARVAGDQSYVLDDAAEMVGLAPDLVRRMWQAAGLSALVVASTDEDLDALRAMKTALDAGLPEEALVQILRVYGEALGRVADAEVRLFHVYVHQRLRQRGLSGDVLATATEAVGDPLQDLVEPTVLYFHRKAWDEAMREDLLTHVAEEAGLWPTIDAEGRLPIAVGFVDLSGFTSLTAAMGDLAAAEVVDHFAVMVREVVGRSPGRVVKQIGDGFMLTFPEAASGLRCGLALEARISAEPQFPAARVGMHWGPVLYREGDYVGATVNIAARVTALAQPHQVVVTQPAVDALVDVDDIELIALGRRRLRGLPDEIALHQARPVAHDQVDKQVDPVCRMELTAAEVSARLSVYGTEHVFCSTSCLELFVATPDVYANP